MMKEISDLWKKYKKTGEPELRDKLIVSYLPLVKYVLGRISLYLPPYLDSEDLTISGVIGLIKSVEEFDLSRQIEFTTFAVPRIRGAILDELRSHDWVPRSARKKAAVITGAINSLMKASDEPPSRDDIAEELSVSTEDIDRMMAEVSFASFLSLEGLRSDTDDGQMKMVDSIKNPKSQNPLDELENTEEEDLLSSAIGALPRQEKIVIMLYYYQNMMLKEIAKLLNLSKSRVSQIHNKAIATLRAKMKSMSIPSLKA
ncbi:MAG TPA: FliA/WhiG family RNA polymerase sigma factor [Planctomycetota bacterium]|nr:FliA/WhiG family RNA polymerase sigma factor [Planctomycetota bacterium]